MPAKWQRWMPFEIDAFKGSPAVQAMPPAARLGYWYLLSDAWQTDDCTIPSDPIDLADRSGLGDELWAIHGPRILRKFSPIENTGRLRNEAEFERWSDAKRIYDARQNAADRTNKQRSPSRSPSADRADPARSLDTRTETETYTNTETSTKTKKPSVKGRLSRRDPDSRHIPFRVVLEAYWKSKNSSEMPWDGSEAKALSKILAAAPALTESLFKQLLFNRYKSDVNHSERPRLWLEYVTNYESGPIDRFNKPPQGANRHANGFGKNSVESSTLELSRSLQFEGVEDGSDQTGSSTIGHDAW